MILLSIPGAPIRQEIFDIINYMEHLFIKVWPDTYEVYLPIKHNRLNLYHVGKGKILNDYCDIKKGKPYFSVDVDPLINYQSN